MRCMGQLEASIREFVRKLTFLAAAKAYGANTRRMERLEAKLINALGNRLLWLLTIQGAKTRRMERLEAKLVNAFVNRLYWQLT